jgi:hypothetical protein
LPKFKLNCIMIWFSTCGGGEKTKHNSWTTWIAIYSIFI